jgi:hypothetical protein
VGAVANLIEDVLAPRGPVQICGFVMRGVAVPMRGISASRWRLAVEGAADDPVEVNRFMDAVDREIEQAIITPTLIDAGT